MFIIKKIISVSGLSDTSFRPLPNGDRISMRDDNYCFHRPSPSPIPFALIVVLFLWSNRWISRFGECPAIAISRPCTTLSTWDFFESAAQQANAAAAAVVRPPIVVDAVKTGRIWTRQTYYQNKYTISLYH